MFKITILLLSLFSGSGSIVLAVAVLALLLP
jgi:hypothetical protein